MALKKSISIGDLREVNKQSQDKRAAEKADKPKPQKG